jgi:hypothetical protein
VADFAVRCILRKRIESGLIGTEPMRSTVCLLGGGGGVGGH